MKIIDKLDMGSITEVKTQVGRDFFIFIELFGN